jgi:hypothetical protein
MNVRDWWSRQGWSDVPEWVRKVLFMLLIGVLIVGMMGAMVAFLARPAAADVIEIRESNEGHAAEIWYANQKHPNATSSPQDRIFELGPVRVRIVLNVNPTSEPVEFKNKERLIVEPLTPGLIAEVESIYVADGEDVVVQLMWAAF